MENVNERYLRWLMGAVGLLEDSQHSFYFLLCRKLFKTPFVWLTEGDQDRAKDGMQLRIFFTDECLENVPDGSVSVLEVLVAFSIRIDEWLSGGEDGARGWFMTMLHNLRLDEFTDDILVEEVQYEMVDSIVERWIRRTYNYDGTGGIFPIRSPVRDQRTCDLDVQLQFYLKENRQLIGIDFG